MVSLWKTPSRGGTERSKDGKESPKKPCKTKWGLTKKIVKDNW